MYKKIYVPVDNSDHSNQAIASAVTLGKSFGAELIGCHVYAAKMHDYRFKQMEYTLPDEYLEETELDRQRQIHDSLISMGLQLISDSYLDPMKRQCADAGLEFTPKMMDGKHHVEILRDMHESDYDLTILGATGIGRVRDSRIGAVCERVTRHATRDVWIVKQIPGKDGAKQSSDTILVGIDGSPQSFGALMTAIDLARRFDKKVEAVSVYDPYLHYSVFNGVVDVLTERAAKVFRFEEQNQLHEEIIDCGLAQIYQSHLDVGVTMAREQDVELSTTLLDGKAWQKVLDHARKTEPWLLVVGRIGVHSAIDEKELGSNVEGLFHECPCDILISTRLEYPELDIKAEESIRWTPEAEERMERVPPLVRGIARTAIYRLAVEQGYSVISSDLLDQAMERFMPRGTADQTTRLAETLAIEAARNQPTSICKKCGLTAAEPDPIKCSICGGDSFQVVTNEMLDRIAKMEGGAEAETTYDGRKLKWTQDAKRALWTMKDAYKRRRAKARVEKAARVRRHPTITLDFARKLIEEEAGIRIDLPVRDDDNDRSTLPIEEGDERKLVARDGKRNPLLSTLEWSADAVHRLFRVPSGYMRDQTQQRTERLVTERGLSKVEDSLVEEGIEVGRKLMEELLAGTEISEPTPDEKIASAKSVDETAALAAGYRAEAANDSRTKDVATSSGNGKTAAGGTCPWAKMFALPEQPSPEGSIKPDGPAEGRNDPSLYLNEVGLMSAMAAKRKKIAEEKLGADD